MKDSEREHGILVPFSVVQRAVVREFTFVLTWEELATLIKLRGAERLTSEQKERIDRFLTRCTKRLRDNIKGRLDVGQRKRGRPRDIDKWKIWFIGAQLRLENRNKWSWRALTRKLDSAGYAEAPQKAMDRMRQGIESVLEEEGKPH